MLKIRPFIHDSTAERTTLAEIVRVHNWVKTDEFIGAFAYATQSGVFAFDMHVDHNFWSDTSTKWLFGIDYGRTHPAALRSISEKANAAVRIHDGAWLLDKAGFIPRRDFHAKASVFLNGGLDRYGMVAGSGNFSSNGLRKSIEAGISLQAKNEDEFKKTIALAVSKIRFLWEAATPIDEIIDGYEQRWSGSVLKHGSEDDATAETGRAANPELDVFWIEAGYVTRNRGPDRPGNQIDFPRGMSRYFGFHPDDNMSANSVIGTVTFLPPFGGNVTNKLRLGNNMMEKISLPIPETHGFDLYDGKVLIFQRVGDHFRMSALETDDFQTAFGDRLSGIKLMTSGRRYGHIT